MGRARGSELSAVPHPPTLPGFLGRQVMYGPLALPGSDSRWMGSAEGWAQSQEQGGGGGAWLQRKPFPECHPP